MRNEERERKEKDITGALRRMRGKGEKPDEKIERNRNR